MVTDTRPSRFGETMFLVHIAMFVLAIVVAVQVLT
jgi:hypothetical protein